MIKKICILSQRYPCKETPNVHVFVQKLAWAMSDNGIDITVISPVSIFNKKTKAIKYYNEEFTSKGNKIKVYRPKYLYLGQSFKFLINFSHISELYFYFACKSVIENEHLELDAFYGHFICLAGICAAKLGRKYNVASFVAYGESDDWPFVHYGIKNIKKELNTVNGIVAVSTNNKNILIQKNIVEENKIKVFINGIDPNVFYPRDMRKSRQKFGLNQNDFIASFVGQFIERKGVLIASKAIEQSKIKGIFAGQGLQKPIGSHVVIAKKLNPEEIPDFLSSSDILVLPSKNEGCSNAILEAMACGLPIIAMDAPFNHDILDNTNSILIKNRTVKEVKLAIDTLMQNPQIRKNMSVSSLNKIKSLSINERAINIIKWMNDSI